MHAYLIIRIVSPSPSRLIVVPGHASFKSAVPEVPAEPAKDDYWALQPFQCGEPPYYIEHIEDGLRRLRKDLDSFLLFSGGRTRIESGYWSEATTYNAIAKQICYFAAPDQAAALELRTDVEEYARDSFENLQFGLCRFYQLFGKYPLSVAVVGWKFKSARFAFHAKTLGLPESSFLYIGCNDPIDLEGAECGEQKALAQFKADPYGTHGPLADKRQKRNPFNLPNPYAQCQTIVAEGEGFGHAIRQGVPALPD